MNRGRPRRRSASARPYQLAPLLQRRALGPDPDPDSETARTCVLRRLVACGSRRAPTRCAGSRLAAEIEYWTAERTAQATPLDAERGALADPGSAAPRARDAAGAPAGTPQGLCFDGLPMVGTFFHEGKPLGGNTYRTGGVVRSKGCGCHALDACAKSQCHEGARITTE